MKVTIDVSPAVNGRAGLGRYAAKIAEGVAAYAANAATHPGDVALFANFTRTGKPIDALAGLPMRSTHMGYKPWRMLLWLAQMARIPMNRLIGATDVYHATEHLLMLCAV